MLKREKEVLQIQLDKEQAVLHELEVQYKRALSDIDDRIKLLQSGDHTQSRIYQIEYQKTLKKQVNAILDKLHADEYSTLEQYLAGTYSSGYIGTMYAIHGQGVPVIAPIDQRATVKAIITDSKLSESLYDALGMDIKTMKRVVRREITRGISSGLLYHDIARNIENVTGVPLSRAKTIARTEGHRIQQASADDARNAAKARGADVVKQWDATLDSDTRSSHRALDGQIREVGEPFEYGWKKAMYPGEFGDPAEDCNCRCRANTRARWALDKDELDVLKERASYFGLDKTDSFAEFEKKYLKAAETVEKYGKSGIIITGDGGVLDLETGVRYHLANGTRLQDVEVFAGKGSKTAFRQAEKYAERYGGVAPDWQHAKGKGVLSTDEGDVKAEIHWVQCDGVGKKKMFVKEWLE